MKKSYSSHFKKNKKSVPPSTLVIVILSVILIILVVNYFFPVSNFTSSKKNLFKGFCAEEDNTSINSSTQPSTSNQSFFQSKSPDTPIPTIVIDAGHGGPDPGKVSTSGTLEKDINLKIAFFLKEMLEAQNINIIMTRSEDKDLATETTHRKLSDIKERVKLMENSNAKIVISIHQNSYPDADVYGAQCFYPTESEAGKELASIIQQQIITSTNQTKIREIKPNNDYYLLKHSSIPIVIVECGFLTNPTEEHLLLTEDYQRQMAWAIHLGILQFINDK